jgi:3-oxoacyl-[acyl-carrier-protein] synthase III
MTIPCAALAVCCCCLAGCAMRSGPSKTEQAYFETYSNETRQAIDWWKQQVDTTRLVREARGAARSTQTAIAKDATAKHDEALQTLRHEYGLTVDEIQAVVNGQINRKIEEELAKGRKKLEVRIDRLEKTFSRTCKDFEKNPKGTVDELKRAENNFEKYLKGE